MIHIDVCQKGGRSWGIEVARFGVTPYSKKYLTLWVDVDFGKGWQRFEWTDIEAVVVVEEENE